MIDLLELVSSMWSNQNFNILLPWTIPLDMRDQITSVLTVANQTFWLPCIVCYSASQILSNAINRARLLSLQLYIVHTYTRNVCARALATYRVERHSVYADSNAIWMNDTQNPWGEIKRRRKRESERDREINRDTGPIYCVALPHEIE